VAAIRVMTMGKSEKFWDRMSGGYDRGDDGAQEGEFPSVVTTRRYLNEDDVVLDFGCATGTLALKIAYPAKTSSR
jgi:cyclopropane fatty-acyl-phospholipid synthase-like methyltransferase